jgi:flagellar biosynthetic protein FliS
MGIGAYRAAKKQASPEQLVLLLFREMLARMERLKHAERTDPAWVKDTHHVRAIVLELNDALDFEESAEISGQLRELYMWVTSEMIRAGRERDPAILPPVITVITALHEGWMAVLERPEEGLKWAS